MRGTDKKEHTLSYWVIFSVLFFLIKHLSLYMYYELKSSKHIKVNECSNKSLHFKFFRLYVTSIQSVIQITGRYDLIRPYFGIYREEQKNLKIVNDFIMKIVKDRRKLIVEGKVTQEECVMDHYFLTPIEGRFLADEEILTEVNTLILGMYDTTQTTAGFVSYTLARYPVVQQKVYEELLVFLKDDPMRLLADDELNQLTYLEAVIRETLRLYPTVPYFGRKLRTEIKIGAYTFPKDVEIMISPYLMGRNPKYFEDPLTFNPDRFHNSETLPLAFAAFSIGAKKCLGQKMAIKHLKISFSKLIVSYKLSLPEDFAELILIPEMVLKPKFKVPVIAVRRH